MNDSNLRFDLKKIDWEKGGGLVPVIVQDVRSMRVLMLGYMNAETLEITLSTGLVTFYSRSKKRPWQKGEESGNVLRLHSIRTDCDNDALLILANPTGPTCHTGSLSCFGNDEEINISVLADLAAVIRQRRKNPVPGSYTVKLFEQGLRRIAQKVGEEAIETALAAATDGSGLAEEAADLLYHLLVLLEASNMDLNDALKVLKERASKTRVK